MLNLLFDRLLNGLAAIGVVLLFAIMVSVGGDVAARYLLASPISWALEFSEYALLAILFLGMPWLAREKGHVSIEIVTDQLRPATQVMLARLSSVACSALLAYLAWWALVQSLNDYNHNIETIGIHPIPRFYLPALAALGLGLTAIEYLRQALTSRPRLEHGKVKPETTIRQEAAL
jgi:C4-dicarboxylate transporter, DctQ subunit